MTDPSPPKEVPVYKAGLVLVRYLESASPEILLVRPKAKRAGERAPLVLPRGTREYEASLGRYETVKNDDEAIKHKDKLEPLTDTMTREAEEEAGVPPKLLQQKKVYDLGAMVYPSLKPRPVQWYVLPLDERDMKSLARKPMDAEETRWVNIGQMKELVAKDEARKGYIPVVEAALTELKAGRLQTVMIPPVQRSR